VKAGIMRLWGALIAVTLLAVPVVAGPDPAARGIAIKAAQTATTNAGSIAILSGQMTTVQGQVAANTAGLTALQVPNLIPAGNRFQFPRKQSASAAGYNMMTVRWHMSPAVDVDGLIAIWYGGYQNQTTGLQPIGNATTVGASIMYPVASAPGASKAFTVGGSTTITVPNGGTVASDLLSLYLPANTPYRVRSFMSPGSGNYIPYGVPCLGSSNGGSLSGFGTATDQSDYSTSTVDTTQASTAHSTNATTDSCMEPLILAHPAAYVPTVALYGDSWTYGALEAGVGGGATASGAGDAYGNVGPYARAAAINGYAYLNFGISGSQLSTWSTDGYSSMMMDVGRRACANAVIALGTNDTLTYSAPTILANLQKMVNKARALGFRKVAIATLGPRTTDTTGTPFITLAGQTTDATRSPVVTAVNAGIRAGQITGAGVIDIGAMVQDPTDPTRWRVDGGVWTGDGTHIAASRMATIAAQVAVQMKAALN
jgi:hypothetical protein